MIVGGFAEPEDERRDVDCGPVSGGQFVEAGGDRAELLQAAETALDDVAGLVELAVEGRRLPSACPRRTRLAFWSARSGITARMPLRRRHSRIARDEYALSAMTASGLRRGRPATARGTLKASMTAAKTVESLTLPGVIRGPRA